MVVKAWCRACIPFQLHNPWSTIYRLPAIPLIRLPELGDLPSLVLVNYCVSKIDVHSSCPGLGPQAPVYPPRMVSLVITSLYISVDRGEI